MDIDKKWKSNGLQVPPYRYSGQELKAKLLQAGFTSVRLYGNLDGDEYGTNASRLVAVVWLKESHSVPDAMLRELRVIRAEGHMSIAQEK
jgi:hypothetical protein